MKITMAITPFRELPYMGVIYVVVEALKLGYSAEDPQWSNLGQGQPEVGTLDGAPPRITNIEFLPSDCAYGPVEGLKELRACVADHYNRLYRRGLPSLYSAENVVIAAGGRTTLSRAFAALDSVRLGYFTPDYTAYEDLLTTYQRVTPVHIQLSPESGFAIDVKELRARVARDKLTALLISNPCNPTGRVLRDQELARWVALARDEKCSLLLDEYYSHYIWSNDGERSGPVSSAAFIEDVDSDPVLIFDGLTKNFRYPGWRTGWALGPKHMCRALSAAGSFVDGGPPRPMQRGALRVLHSELADQETNAVRRVFREKRDIMLQALSELGITFPRESEGTFYTFGSIAKLPKPLNDGMSFFRKALQYKVLTVPGEFFDVNPLKARKGPSPLANFVRFSFGPPKENMIAGLARLQQMISSS